MHVLSCAPRSLAVLLVLAATTTRVDAQCGLDWQPGPIAAGPNGAVTDLKRLPNGDLLATGFFRWADGALANGVARFDGTSWQSLGGGVAGGLARVHAATVASNGDVIVGGNFTSAGGVAANRIARWNGSTWAPLGSGLGNDVSTLLTLANGDVIAGGLFANAGTVPASRIARWNGTTWAPIGSGLSGTCLALAQRPNGDLIAGGTFANGVAVLRWDGATWSPIIPGYAAYAVGALPNGDVVAGGLLDFGGVPVGLARWNGTQASAFATPLGGQGRAFAIAPNGDLLVGTAGGPAGLPVLGAWNGAAWTVLPSAPLTNVTELVVEPSGGVVLAGASPAAAALGTIVRWTGTGFATVGNPTPPPSVARLVQGADGSVYAGGTFAALGGTTARNVAQWRDGAWRALGAGVDGRVTALAPTADGGVVVAGEFQHAGGGPAARIARWNGTSWSTLAGGLGFAPLALAVDAAGDVFALTGNDIVLHRFDGLTWSVIPLPPQTVLNATNLLARPDGELWIGGMLGGVWRYSGGTFTALGLAGNVLAMANTPDGGVVATAYGTIQHWDGSAWTVIAGALGNARAFTFLPDGDLIAVGSLPGGGTSYAVWRHDGAAWSLIDGGLPGTSIVTTAAAAASGELFVAGLFDQAGGHLALGFAQATPTCRAAAAPFGAGCSGAAGPLTLATGDLPWTGATFTATAAGFPAQALGLHAIGEQPLQAPLPGGAPGCSLFVQPVVLDLVLPLGGVASPSFVVPNDPSLAGRVLRTQVAALELDASGGLVRITSSNALDLTIGAL